MRFLSPRLWPLAALLLAGACRRGPAQDTPAGPASALPSASAPARLAAATSAAGLPTAGPSAAALLAAGSSSRPAPAPSGSAPLTPEEQASARRYLENLGRGRKLTTRQSYPEAVKAFDEALRELPGDPRALSERGYARLQAGDLDGAERDFYAALGRSPDRAVLSATTYNLALIAERRGHPELAGQLREAARHGQAPRPPTDRCPASILRGKFISASGEVKKLQTLRQVRTALREYAERNAQTITPPLPTTDEEAALKQELLGGGEGPWHLMTGPDDHLLFGKPLDYTLRLGASVSYAYRCGSTYRRQVSMAGHPTVSSLTQDYNFSLTCARNQAPSPGEPLENCYTGCAGPMGYNQEYTVFDRATGEPLLGFFARLGAARDETPLDPISLVTREDGVQLLGNGCNAFEPFQR